ncbi:MBL fold metallo-hydrolase [Cellulomonas sp. P22]|uniref:MBL fold metallo-hydrolase n=1 Tax=Cellulomonas sp. P22 TaxID=3373189 RepID=UPI00378ED518
MTTDLTSWGHSCVRLERDGRRLVIDPGVLSDARALDGAQAVLLTHAHPDHVDVSALRQVLDVNPALEVWAPPDVVLMLADGTAVDERLHGVTFGDRVDAAGFDVEVFGSWHAVVHPDIPLVPNVAYLIDEALLHPGDSFTVPDGRTVDTLLTPVGAPWLKISEAVDYVRAITPRVVVPIHDGVLSPPGKTLVDRVMREQCPDVEYLRLTPADPLPVS